jgi:uncharacterized protein
MKPRVHVITLGVHDLERSLAFYRSLGLESEGVVASEFLGDDEMAAGAIVMFQLERGLILCLFPRNELAKDAKVPPALISPGQFSIGHAVGSREEVDALLATAASAGATRSRHMNDLSGCTAVISKTPTDTCGRSCGNPALEDL